jgi:peptidylprolyl isomerase
MRALVAIVAFSGLAGACQKASEDKKDQPPAPQKGQTPGSGATVKPTPAKPDQIAPPFDLKTPPVDAVKTATGLVYKKLATNDTGTAPKRNDVVLINFTGWKQQSGETFYSNAAKGAPMPLPLANAAPGFTEALQLMKTGEKAMLWVPPEIGYRGPPQGKPEMLVYLVELVKVDPAPEVPASFASPPATALVLKPSDVKYEVVRPGTGTEKARSFDTVTFNYTAWDKTGRMFDSTEVRKRPAVAPPYRQTATMESVLTSTTAGERIRFWADAAQMQLPGQTSPNSPTGLVCYELEVEQIAKAAGTPPPPPADVAKPPEDAKKTEKGVFYKVLKTGKGGAKPKPTDSVAVNYTGWTTNGRMFDSSALKGKPAEFRLNGVVEGWTDGLQVMSPGDTMRFWIPEALAYKGAPDKPQGMLVFDIELLEIKAPPNPDAPPPPGGNPHAPPHHP